jgi:c-di-GMP-binding flagellar brake protein YcgR
VEVVAWKVGMYIVLRIHKMDQAIRALTEYEPILLRCFNVDGSVHAFETKCLEKKIPYLVVRFPVQENVTRKRKQRRQLVCLETPIILKDFKRKVAGEKVAGMGTILDISDGGCAIETKMECHLNEEINFFLDVGTKNRKNILELKGLIRNIKDLGTGAYNLGIEFRGLDSKTKSLLKDFKEKMMPSKPEGSPPPEEASKPAETSTPEGV